MAKLIQILGYFADTPATAETAPKHVCFTWRGESGSAGIVHFTGTYWAIVRWQPPTPAERDEIKSVVRRIKLSTLTYLGVDPYRYAFDQWWGRVPFERATNAQLALLAKFGQVPRQSFPALVASTVIGAVRAASAFLKGEQLAAMFVPDRDRVLRALQAFASASFPDVPTYWRAACAIEDEIFRTQDQK